MKKFISMVMAAAMVVSLVPATAFAGDTGEAKAVAKIIDKDTYADGSGKVLTTGDAELQLKVNGDGQYTSAGVKHELTFTLDGAEFTDQTAGTKIGSIAGELTFNGKPLALATGTAAAAGTGVYYADTNGGAGETAGDVVLTISDVEDDSFKLTITARPLEDEDLLVLGLGNNITLDSDNAGATATVSVEGDLVTAEDLVFAEVKDNGISVSLKKVAEVAEEDTTVLEKKLVIESDVDDFVAAGAGYEGQKFELKLNNGFEWDTSTAAGYTAGVLTEAGKYTISKTDDENIVVVEVLAAGSKVEIANTHLTIDAASAKAGDVAKITVKAIKGEVTVAGPISGGICDGLVRGNAVPGTFKDTADAVEAAKVVAEGVTLKLTDEDEDLPVIYSGVNVANWGITDDSDHKALKFTLEESTPGALDVKKAFNITLPEGVYATDVDVTVKAGKVGTPAVAINDTTIETAIKNAYKKGEHETFEFARKVFAETTAEAFELEVEMTLIAEPGFEGDVTVKLDGDAFDDEAEVVIAKFVSPYTVEAAQNDLIIDYRNTEVPTTVVVKEAEAGLWDADKMNFIFDIDRMENAFEKDATFTVNDESEMEVKAVKGTDMGFIVTEESDDEAAVVTISDISLYMSRNLAAGAYDLDLYTEAGQKMLTTDKLFTADEGEIAGEYYAADFIDLDYDAPNWDEQYYTVKEGFINIITAGRDQDDASFTKKVVVPVGENYIVAGEETVTLDVPAYISAAGYTMLPVRAVAVALGINNNNVLWDQATKTVTILYGQRIITMVAGQKVVYVNGSAIPASASVEIKDGRTFLPMRDLATALGVTDITWDAATKTATLNGSK